MARRRSKAAGSKKKAPPQAVTSAPPAGERRLLWIGSAVILLALLVAYIPALRGGFIWDDDVYVFDNETLRDGEGLRRLWFEFGATPQYYPLVFTSFWIEYQLWQARPFGYHLVNVLLQALGAVLLWLLLRRLSLRGAWIAAAIFALHPVLVESVAWITERKNVLSGVFYFLTLLAYFRFADPEDAEARHSKARRAYVWALLLFTCALFSKTSTVVLPAVILLILWWKRGRLGWRDVRPVLPFFALAVAAGLITTYVETYLVGAEGEAWTYSLVERVLIAGRVIWFYFGKLVWPSNLSLIYPSLGIDAGVWWQYIPPLAALAVVAALWLGRRRLGRGPLVAALYFGGCLFPVLGFFKVYFMQYAIVADHFQYLASIGPIALTGVLLAKLSRADELVLARLGGSSAEQSQSSWARVLPVALVLLVLATLTWRQNRNYKDIETIWLDVLAKNPVSWMAHNNLGKVHHDRKEFDQAAGFYHEALRLKPDLWMAHFNLGDVRAAQGRDAEAVGHMRDALHHTWNESSVPVIRKNLAEALVRLGRPTEAAEEYAELVRLKPGHAVTHARFAMLLLQLGRLDLGIEQFRLAVEAQPRGAELHYLLANALKRKGMDQDATEAYRKALALQPGHAKARQELDALLESRPATDNP